MKAYRNVTFPKLKSESNDLLHLDALRIFASAAIVVLHFRVHLQGAPIVAVMAGRLDTFKLAVDLFFLISGFVISYVYANRIHCWRDYGVFLQKRVARLVPLHWATASVFILIGATLWLGLLPANHPEFYNPYCVVPNLLLVHAYGTCPSLSLNGVSWSVSAEMGLYIAFPLFISLARRWWLGVAVVVVLILALSWVSQSSDRAWYNWTSDFGVLRGIPGFLIGALCYQLRDRLARLKYAEWLLAGLGLLFLAGTFAGVSQGFLIYLVYLIGICGVAASLQPASRFISAVAPYGQLTYSIYMLHPLIEVIGITFIGEHILHLHGWTMNVLILFCAAMILPISYLSLMWFETPMRRAISRLNLFPLRGRLTGEPGKLPTGT